METTITLKNKIKAAREAIENGLPIIMQEAAQMARVLAERNIVEKGFGETYSTNEVPAFFFLGKELNEKGEKAIKDAQKSKKGLTWGAFREAQGLQSNHVDLHYSNEMFRGLSVTQVYRNGNKFFAVLGSTTETGKQKMEWNFKRYGDFLTKSLGDKEREILADLANEGIAEIIKNNLG